MNGSIFALSIKRITARIDDPAKHLRSDPDRWTRAPRNQLIAESYSLRLIGRHGQHRRTAEADDLAGVALSAMIHDQTRFTHRTKRPFGLNQVADNLTDSAVPSKRRAGLEVMPIRS